MPRLERTSTPVLDYINSHAEERHRIPRIGDYRNSDVGLHADGSNPLSLIIHIMKCMHCVNMLHTLAYSDV